mmetsp:Transcript_10337/g.24358  ORF Transcript_10337/g.24358 Transcript_10337/m.24358 type:complete len:202 (+) Transcript_10337:640-1245(+)
MGTRQRLDHGRQRPLRQPGQLRYLHRHLRRCWRRGRCWRCRRCGRCWRRCPGWRWHQGLPSLPVLLPRANLGSQCLVVASHEVVRHLLAVQQAIGSLLPDAGLLLCHLHGFEPAVLLVPVVEGHPLVFRNLMQGRGASHRLRVVFLVLLTESQVVDEGLSHGAVHHYRAASLSGLSGVPPLDAHLMAVQEVHPWRDLLHLA